MKNDSLIVELHYQLKDENKWNIERLSVEDYFDLDENECAEVDSVPKYTHAIEYFPNKNIVGTKVIIVDTSSNKKRIITTKFWNNQENFVIERKDYFGEQCDVEIIIETKMIEPINTYEIMRIAREDDILVPVYHGFITDVEDGSQLEKRIL